MKTLNNKLICILGATCSGKDTVRKKLQKQHSQFITAISHTTRPMRSTENGTEYYFIDNATFNAMYDNGEFVEVRSYEVIGENNESDYWYYGYSVEEINHKLKQGNILMILDLQGFKEFKEIYGDDCIGFYISVDTDIRVQRYLNRDKLTYAVVKECIRRIDDDDNRAFKGVEEWVNYVVESNSSQITLTILEEKLKELNILP